MEYNRFKFEAMSQMIEERGLLNLRVEPRWPTATAGDKVWKHTQATNCVEAYTSDSQCFTGTLKVVWTFKFPFHILWKILEFLFFFF